jgi:hypothetical protein
VQECRWHIAVVVVVAQRVDEVDRAAEQGCQDHRNDTERAFEVPQVLNEADHLDEVAVGDAVLLVGPGVEALGFVSSSRFSFRLVM